MRLLGLSLMVLVLAGCTPFFGLRTPPPQSVTLGSNPAPPAANTRAENVVLGVDSGFASPMLEGRTIMVIDAAGTVRRVDGYRWAARPAVLMQEGLIDWWRANSDVTVAKLALSERADWQLRGSIEHFALYEQNDGDLEALVRWQLLLRGSGGERHTHMIEQRLPARASDPKALVATLRETAQAVLADAGAWLQSSIDPDG